MIYPWCPTGGGGRGGRLKSRKLKVEMGKALEFTRRHGDTEGERFWTGLKRLKAVIKGWEQLDRSLRAMYSFNEGGCGALMLMVWFWLPPLPHWGGGRPKSRNCESRKQK